MAATKRRMNRPGLAEPEDAALLKLGQEFEGVECLTISEVSLLLNLPDHLNRRRQKPNAIRDKTWEYVNTFQRFHTLDAVSYVRKIPETRDLEGFEIAQIANLCCEEAEEAMALIPSLTNKIHEKTLQDLLKDLTSVKQFQG